MNKQKQIIFGLIGCGAVGKLIINSIVPFAIKNLGLQKCDVHISTRRPEQIQYYEKMGYKVYFNNDRLLKQCNFVVLAFPPVVDNWNLLELQFKEEQYIVSVISTITLQRLKQLTKREFNTFTTIIDQQVIQIGLNGYNDIMESSKPGVFQTQLIEDIGRLIMEESFRHYNKCLGLFMESFEGGIDDNLTQAMFGRSVQELEGEYSKHFKSSFNKALLQFQNYACNI